MKKRTLCIFLSLVLVLGMLPGISMFAAASDPQPISNQTELAGMVDEGKYYLTQDITIDETWLPLYLDNIYLDGAGYTISGLQITEPGGGPIRLIAGLFAALYDSTIENLTVDGSIEFSTPVSMNVDCGGIAGYASNSDISSCINKVNIDISHDAETLTSSELLVGGIVGDARNSSFSDCENSGSIKVCGGSFGTNCGGIAGHIFNSVVTGCINKGSVEAQLGYEEPTRAGGIAGYSQLTHIDSCRNNADVSAQSSFLGNAYAGGIAGELLGEDNDTIINCSNYGDIYAEFDDDESGNSSSAFAGGLAGYANYDSVFNSYNRGTVTAETTYSVALTSAGGIAGRIVGGHDSYISRINNAYSSGAAHSGTENEGSNYEGGIAGSAPYGFDWGQPDVSYSYALKDSCQYLGGEAVDNCYFFQLDGGEYRYDSDGGSNLLLDSLNEWVTDNSEEGEHYEGWVLDQFGLPIFERESDGDTPTPPPPPFIPPQIGLPYYLNGDEKVFIGFAADSGGVMNYIAPVGKSILFAENPKEFTDIGASWAKSSIDFVTEREIFVGISENIFSPETGMTRAMFAAVLGRLYERSYGALDSGDGNDFIDVDNGSWYIQYINWAAKNRIIEGVGANKFEPERMATRAEMAVMLSRFTQFLKLDIGIALPAFDDNDSIPDWAWNAVGFMQESGIIVGRPDNNFAPNETASREETAAALERFVRWVVK